MSPKTNKFLKIFLFYFFGIILLVAIFFTLSYFIINLSANKFIYNDVNKLPHAQAVVVPGAAILLSGEISPVLKDRADIAIEIYKQGIADKILVTGDNGTLEHNEVNPVRKYLLKNSIPDQDIFLDHAGFDTYSSMYRAKSVFKIETMIIASQNFHLPRAVYIARHLGVQAFGISADRGHYLIHNNIRELFGDVKAIGDLFTKRQPKYLGKEIPITGDGRENYGT